MKKRVLVVEDDDLVRETIEYLLVHNGFNVLSKATGADMLSIVSEFRPELILLDILLPDADGRDICRELKQHSVFKHIPILVVSAVPEIYNSISQEGANDVVLKPFEERTLLNRVYRQISNSRSPFQYYNN